MSYKVLIPRRPLVLGIARQHALQTDAHALDVMYRAPSLAIEQVETDDAVGVDVRVHGDWVCCVFDEDDFRCLCDYI